MSTSIEIYPSQHVEISWRLLEQTIRRWSGDAMQRLWGPRLELELVNPDGPGPLLSPESVLEPRHAYRIRLEGNDHGASIYFLSIEDRLDRREALEALGTGVPPEQLDEIAEGIKSAGYYMIVSIRPSKEPYLSRLKVAAGALAELLGGSLGTNRDDYPWIGDRIFSLGELRAMTFPIPS